MGFWDKEYKKNGAHFALSDNPSEDLVTFIRWLEKEHGLSYAGPRTTVLDLGCGNGRNLIYLARKFGVRGAGIDSSHEAIREARGKSAELPLVYKVRSVVHPLPVPDLSQSLVLLMMTLHFLTKNERANLYKEMARVLKPSGWLYLKTFLLEDDRHARRLLSEHPAEEAGSYVHPKFGGVEHVFTEDEIRADLALYFTVEKIAKSHRHRGPRGKRRSMSVYARKRD